MLGLGFRVEKSRDFGGIGLGVGFMKTCKIWVQGLGLLEQELVQPLRFMCGCACGL